MMQKLFDIVEKYTKKVNNFEEMLMKKSQNQRLKRNFYQLDEKSKRF